jgi:hypothetical protein
MFKFLLTIFLFGFVLFSLLGFSVARSFKEFFGGGSKKQSASQGRQSSQTKGSTRQQQTSRKKVIDPNEGEYVDYEEIKG